jgi:nucleoside-triphosphatase THEP1
MIFILTGPIRSGKSTAIDKWCNSCVDVDGIVCLDNSQGKRYFKHIQSQEKYDAEAEIQTKSEVIPIGNFIFSQKAFDTANAYLLMVNKKSDYKYLVMDELGKLELKNKGLHDSAKSIVLPHLKDVSKHIILLVRETLLNEIVAHYEISHYKVLKKEDLTKLNALL